MPTGWNPPLLVLAGGALAAFRFTHAFVRLRRRGRLDHARWNRAALFGAGLLFVALPLSSPLDTAADGYLFSAHKVEHLAIGDAAPALLLLAVRGPLLAFMVPPVVARLTGPRSTLHPLRRTLTSSWFAVVSWCVTLAVWHIPALYDSALAHPVLHEIEHATFFASGLLLWAKLLGLGRAKVSASERLAVAGVVFAAGQILGTVLFLAARPLYPTYASEPVRLLGLDALTDQRVAGLAMMAEQLVTLGALALIVMAGALRASRPEQSLGLGLGAPLIVGRKPLR